MMYSVDMLDKVLNEEQAPDPSVTPDTSILDLQAIVERLDRLEQAVSTLRQTDNSKADNDLNTTAVNNDLNDNKGDEDNEG